MVKPIVLDWNARGLGDELLMQAESARAAAQLIRIHLQQWPVTGKDQRCAMRALQEWGWHGLREEMRGCTFPPYVGESPSGGPIPYVLEAEYAQAEKRGLASAYYNAHVARATLEAAQSLLRFYEALDANACYCRKARTAFNVWAMYQMCIYEAPRFEAPNFLNHARYWASIIRPAYAVGLRRTRDQWEWKLARTLRAALAMLTPWTLNKPDPFWVALADSADISEYLTRFEPGRGFSPAADAAA